MCWFTCVSVWACMCVCVHKYISVMTDVSVSEHALRNWRRTSGAGLLPCWRHDLSSVSHIAGSLAHKLQWILLSLAHILLWEQRVYRRVLLLQSRQDELRKQQRGWLQNTCKRGRAPRLSSDNHASDSRSGRALVAAFLKAATATAAMATRSNKQLERTAREGPRGMVGIEREWKNERWMVIKWQRRNNYVTNRVPNNCPNLRPKSHTTGCCQGLRNLLEVPGSYSVVAA